MAEGWVTLAEFAFDAKFGKQSANKLRQQIRALAAARPIYAGGDRHVGVRGVVGALTLNARNWIDLELDGDYLAGFTVRLRCEVRTDSASTSVTPKLRQITTGADAATGTACSAIDQDFQGTNQIQTLTVTLTAGVNKYRFQLVAGDENADVYGIAYLEIKLPA